MAGEDMTAPGNGSSEGMPPQNTDWIVACKCLIVIIGLVGNILVIGVVLSNKNLRRQPAYILIVSLSIVVLYALILIIPFDIHAAILGHWPGHLDGGLCKFNGASAMFFYASTALNTAMIALNRYFATVWYQSYDRLSSPLVLGIMLAICYILPIICLIPFYVGTHAKFDTLSMSCYVTGEWRYDRYAWTMIFFGFCLMLMIYCFVHIFVDIYRKKHDFLTTRDDVDSTKRKELRRYFNEVKTVKVAVVLFVLMLLRLPSAIAPMFVPREALFVTMNSTLLIGLSALMFYPFVYVLMSKDFRQATKSLFCCECTDTRETYAVKEEDLSEMGNV